MVPSNYFRNIPSNEPSLLGKSVKACTDSCWERVRERVREIRIKGKRQQGSSHFGQSNDEAGRRGCFFSCFGGSERKIRKVRPAALPYRRVYVINSKYLFTRFRFLPFYRELKAAGLGVLLFFFTTNILWGKLRSESRCTASPPKVKPSVLR